MTNNTFLQIFLGINFILVGIILVIASQHAYAHFFIRKVKKPDYKPKPEGRIPPNVQRQMIEDAKDHFTMVIDNLSVKLEKDLETTTDKIDKQLHQFGSKIISDEMERYHKALQKLQQQTEVTMSGAQVAINNHQKELVARLDQRQAELEAEAASKAVEHQQQLIEQIDTKLADGVMAFLTETLQHNVDLGAQTNYLISSLDEHKAELIKDLKNET